MTILYVFPHPDDESFGPAPAIAHQRREGHDVYLLTLTKGEATSQREVHGYTKEEMGEVRYREMQHVAKELTLSGMRVLDFADGELDRLDPRELEEAVRTYADEVRPDVMITYAVHGISGHPDHLISHAIVKRVFCEMRELGAYPRRLAFFTLSPEDSGGRPPHLKSSPKEAIDAVVTFDANDLAQAERALERYVTYKSVIDEHQPLNQVTAGVCFELFQETFDPPLDTLTDQLPT